MSIAPYDPHEVAGEIKRTARALGFDLVGIAPAHPSAYADFMRQWLADGKHGEMTYLADRIEERLDPTKYLHGAKSVICVAVNYFHPLKEPAGGAKVARYALGDDYHQWIKPKLYDLADWLRDRVPGSRTRCATDTAPVMEREMAARAGIGWLAKNTCVINETGGSWMLLGEVLTTLGLPYDNPAVDRCGTCTRCIDACPTQALEPYRIDARRCISYLTIETRGEIPSDLQKGVGDWLFGCDICQDVCPHNRAPAAGIVEALRPRFPTGELDPTAVAHWSRAEYQRTLKGSAMKRVKLEVLQRNAETVLANRK